MSGLVLTQAPGAGGAVDRWLLSYKHWGMFFCLQLEDEEWEDWE